MGTVISTRTVYVHGGTCAGSDPLERGGRGLETTPLDPRRLYATPLDRGGSADDPRGSRGVAATRQHLLEPTRRRA